MAHKPLTNRTTPYWQPGNYSRKERQAVENMAESLFAAYVQRQRFAHDPLLGLGLELGATITPCDPRPENLLPTGDKNEAARTAEPQTVEQGTPDAAQLPPQLPAVRIDVELARLAVATRRAACFRVWAVAHALGNGSGFIDRVELLDALTLHGYVASKRTFDQQVQRGAGTFWTYDSTTGRLYLAGAARLAVRLTRKVQVAGREAVISTNEPGATRAYVDLSGELVNAEARIYAAWVRARQEQAARRSAFFEISRANLQALWNRSKTTLLNWEKLTNVQTEDRFTEHHETTGEMIPKHAYLCLDEAGTAYTSWRLPNRFSAPPIEIHPHAGQRRKIRAAVRAMFTDVHDSTAQAAHKMGGGSPRIALPGRLNFYNRRQWSKRHGYEFKDGHKLLSQHLKKHGDVFTPHHAEIETRYGIHIMECTLGDHRRGTPRDYHAEQTPEFKTRRMWHKIGLQAT